MPYVDVIWDLDEDPDGNVQDIADHGLTKDDVRWELENPVRRETSRSSGRPVVFGYTPDDDAQTVYPVTAYEVEQ